MLSNFFICVNANNEVASHGLGLPQRVGVTEVHHVVAPVAPHTNVLQIFSHCRSGNKTPKLTIIAIPKENKGSNTTF